MIVQLQQTIIQRTKNLPFMKPETILQSHVLDIIFENRNKDYGAYALRKNYNNRLLQALGGTILLVGLFIVLQSMDFSDRIEEPKSPFDGMQLTSVNIPEDKPQEPLPEEKPKQTEASTTLNAAVPEITKDPVETTIATQEAMSNANLGTKTEIIEIPGGSGDSGFADNRDGKTIVDIKPVEPIVESNMPLDHADVMPSFNGDIVRFMLRHLRQPDDIEEGERIVVRVKFVVTKDGEINNVQVIQSGRRDLDDEVIRVVKKMPRWNPGKQAGRFVPVYFNLPVTFVSNSE